jgi:GNAT superfamily N-acetyltransferase
MGLTIRFAVADDAATIYRFISELAEYERAPDAVETTPDILFEQLSKEKPPFECLIAEAEGKALGFALFFHNYSTWRGCQGIYLEDLFVPPRYRGNGVGRVLLQTLASIAAKRGCARVEWAVLDWNEPAFAFYERIGAVRMDDWVLCRLTGQALRELAIPMDGSGIEN